MLKFILSITIFLLFASGCGAPVSECPRIPPPLQEKAIIQDSFDSGILYTSLWKPTEENDFTQKTVDVYDADPSGKTDYRLRLLANTIGTKDDTVKYLGVRSLQKIDFSTRKVISFDIDWNNQSNGSYLTAGLFLCPVATDINPKNEPDWLAFEYIGVPPGQNARFQVSRASEGRFNFLYTEGWPEQRTGRQIGNQHIEIAIAATTIEITENGRDIYSTDHGLEYTQVHIYLQMSSHSNYPTRVIYFDNIKVEQ